MKKKERVIEIEAHAFLRMLERGAKYGLNYYECKDRAFKTVRLGNLAKRKHLSKNYIAYYNYFHDNLSFYVICDERDFDDFVKVLIKTVIIEKGRE